MRYTAAGGQGRSNSDIASRAGVVAVGLLLVLCLVSGGSSQQSGVGVFAAQLLALPMLAWAGWRLLRQPTGALHIGWLVFALALVAIPLLQVLASGEFADSSGRRALSADLSVFGEQGPALWSLAPSATTAGGFLLLPALALFAMVMTLPYSAQAQLAKLLVLMAVASLTLGVAQLGAPQESPLNPYPQWQPAMNGFFANQNHQATLLVVAATLACARLTIVVGVWPAGRPRRIVHGVAAAVVLVLAAVALPLTGSRAGVILIILACALVVLAHWPAWRGGARSRVALLACMGAAAFALFVSLRWMQVEAIDELRGPLRALTGEIAARFAPMGAGVGSYVPVFEQEAPRNLLMANYVNHAHNEYAQWWLEAGVPAIATMLLSGGALALTLRGLLHQPAQARGTGVTALAALGVIMAHSVVDYPLRTPALLAVAAVLAGIAASQAAVENIGRYRAKVAHKSQATSHLQGDAIQ